MGKTVLGILMCSIFLVQCSYSYPKAMSTQTDQETRFTVKLDGHQEVPPKITNGSGTAVFTLNAQKTELSYDVTVTDLSGPVTAAHIHNAPAGVGGVAVFTLSFEDHKASGVWKNTDTPAFTPEMAGKLAAGELFINVHTEFNPTGEIRGQLMIGH